MLNQNLGARASCPQIQRPRWPRSYDPPLNTLRGSFLDAQQLDFKS